jgi:hypothetical protein
LSEKALITLSADLQVQLEKGTAYRPVLWMLSASRKRAMNAVTMMVNVNPSDSDAVRQIQNEIKLYLDQIEACKTLLERGKLADQKISEESRDELSQIVMSEDDARMYGQPNQGYDA